MQRARRVGVLIGAVMAGLLAGAPAGAETPRARGNGMDGGSFRPAIDRQAQGRTERAVFALG